MSISDFISIISIMVSLIAIIIAFMANRKANKLQEEVVNIEKSRESDRQMDRNCAQLIAYIKTEQKIRSNGGISDYHNFVIENKGQSEARNIRVFINERRLQDCEWCMDNSQDNIKVIGSGGSKSFQMLLHSGIPKDEFPPFTVKLIWEDRAKTDNTWESEINFG